MEKDEEESSTASSKTDEKYVLKEEDESAEEEAPPPMKQKKQKKKSAEDEEEARPKKKRQPKKKKKKKVESSSEEEESSDDVYQLREDETEEQKPSKEESPSSHNHFERPEIKEEDLVLSNEGKITEHLFDIGQLETKFQVKLNTEDPNNSEGLNAAQAQERNLQFGLNALKPPKELPEIVKFLKQFLNLFMVMMMIAGILSIIAFAIDRDETLNLYLGIILFVIVFFTCCMSYFEERKTSNVIKSFQKMLPQACKVIREGKVIRVKPDELAIGDIVKLATGDKVPADMRMLFVSSLKVEQASLTGESEPIECFLEAQSEDPMEAKNVVFNSCLVLEGEGTGIVIRTGEETVIGRIAKQSSQAGHMETQLSREVKHFVYFIAVLAVTMGVILFITGAAQGQDIIFVFVNGFIVIVIANVPQGLPATITSCLTIVAKRLAKKNVLVKQLETVETLGAATLIASDKTGTLTENRMTVQNLWFDGSLLPASEAFHAADLRQSKTFKRFYHVCALCNRAYFGSNPEAQPIVLNYSDNNKSKFDALMPLRFSSEWKRSMERRRTGIVGDASETALLAFADKYKPVEPTRDKYRKIFEIPFNSKNKYQLSIHERTDWSGSSEPSPRLLVFKGAPEIVMARCTHYLKEGKARKLDNVFRKEYDKIYAQLGKSGERVLGLAFVEMPPDPRGPGHELEPGEKPEFPEKGYTFVGLVSMVDPPKSGVAEAIQKCRTAGIRVVMVTGDHPFTAEAIARKVGIIKDCSTREEIAKEMKINPSQVDEELVEAAVIPGPQLETFTEEQWKALLSKKELVFARTTPQHKLQIVEHFQQMDEVVAVTGDGVNDSIALKKANIGVAMGRGSDVAKDASDIIILDDNFASIVVGIEQGRVLFDNLKKTVAFTLTHLLPEVIPIVLTLTAGMPLGLSSLLVLSIDLGTELAPAISMAYETAEADVMMRQPRNAKRDKLVSPQLLIYSYLEIGVIESLACLFSYFMVFWVKGIPPSSLVGSVKKNYFKHDAPDWTIDGTVFTADDQLEILAIANGAYYITLVMSQLGHVWMCKTRTQSLFTHGIKNLYMNLSFLLSVCIMVIVVYVPKVQEFFSASTVDPIFWLPWVVSIIVIWVFAEVRKYFTRTKPRDKVVKALTW